MSYDPMVAKICTYGSTREQAIRRMRRAIEETSVLGIETNLALHLVILEDHRFHAGNYDTGLLADLPQSTTTIPNPLDILAVAIAEEHSKGNTESRQVTEHTSQWVLQAPPSPAGRFELKYFVTINDQEHCVELKKSKDGQYHYTLDDGPESFVNVRQDGKQLHLLTDTQSRSLTISLDSRDMTGGGPRAPFRVESEMVRALRTASGGEGTGEGRDSRLTDAWSRRKIPSERRRPRERWTGGGRD